jgi:predicted outer membrane repeat protein
MAITFLLFYFADFECKADTIVWSGNMELTADQFISAQQTLNVLPGTVVTAMGSFKIEVKGNMIAEGTEDNLILFTANDTVGLYDSATISGGWHGIHLLDNNMGQSRFSYCTFEYGKANIPGSWYGWGGYSDDLSGNQGGAIRIYNYQRVEFEHCTFIYNYSRTSGGGIYCEGAQNIKTSNCTYIGNKTMVKGGALFAFKNDYLLVTGSTFRLNRAWYTIDDSSGDIIVSHGAAIFLALYPETTANTISNNSFYNNYSLSTVADQTVLSTVMNNVFTNNNNIATLTFNVFESAHDAFNNTIANNFYDNSGIPGIYTVSENLRLYNNILWNNFSENIKESDMAIVSMGSPPDVNYNLIWEGRAEGSNMITDDPLFVNPAPNFGLESNGWEYDWSLQDDSPAVNAGTPDTTGMNLLPEDLAGNPRIFGNRIDMGAYENQHVWVKINDSPVYAHQIKVYPNPGTDRIMVALPENTQDAWIELMDGTGQRVLLERVYANLCVITPTHLSSGIYFYRICNQDQVFKKGKWVKK